MTQVTSEQRARQIAHHMSVTYAKTLMHVIRDGADHYVRHDGWSEGEIIVGRRVATYRDGQEVRPVGAHE